MDVAVKAPVFTSQTRVTPELRSEVERVSDGLSTHQDVVELARRVAEEDGQSWDRHPLAGEVNTESGFLSFRSTRHRQGFWPLSLLKPDIEKFEIRAMDYRTKDEDGTPRHTTVYTKAAGRAVYTDSDLANRTVADGFLVTCGTVRTEDEGYGARTDHMHAEGAWPVDGTARPAAYQFHIDGVTNGRVTWDSRQTWEVKFDPSAAATPAQKAVSPKIQAMEETFQALSAAAREMEGEKAGRTGGGLLIEGEVPGFGAVKGEKDWEIGAHDASCLKLESDTASFSSSSGIRGERYFTIQDKATGFEQDLKLCGDGTVEYSESERLPRNERPEPEPFIVRGSKFEDDGSCGFGSGSSW